MKDYSDFVSLAYFFTFFTLVIFALLALRCFCKNSKKLSKLENGKNSPKDKK
jgi:hypothetical protein